MEAKKWWKEAVVYQIYPRSFMDSNGDGIGDLNGIRQKLDYLKELGVDVIWISPFYKSPMFDNGYDISDYKDINPEFGTMADFDALLADAHSKGLKIVVDLVVNHTSYEHKWFLESKKNKTNPYRNFYIWKDPKNGKEPNNWGSCFSGPAWKYDENTKQYYLHLFTPEQPDLNWENPQVRKEVFDMMNWWCKKGIDGFRMDVIGFLNKDQNFPDGKIAPGALYGDFVPFSVNRDGVHDYIKEMHREVLSKYDLLTVGECSSAKIEDALKFAGYERNELNMIFQFERIDSEFKGSKWFEKPFDLVTLKKIMNKWQTQLDGKAWNTLFWENHDQPRIVSRYNGDSSDEKRVLCAKMLATSLYFQKGTPYIYQGQELGMTNNHFEKLEDFRDIESINAFNELTSKKDGVSKERMMYCLNRVSRDNARTPMQWSAEKNAGFSSGSPWIGVNANYKTINAQNQINDPNSVYSYFKKINQLRKTNPVIVYGDFEMHDLENRDLLVYTRKLDDKKLLIITNFTGGNVKYKIPDEFSAAKIMLGNYDSQEKSSEDLILRPYEALVFYKD